ncbi:DUF5038 domain-containing protein [Schaedlerella arabinosiphila]|jgi:hypothetical protein|uniref:DUF5038 domain-containing protein n=1 Tax=Schaedlerella arabinosiphila TaxID=2044587 RepID=A0A3R8R7W3_9FIRM|nr:DUF5038 domain-containing protein [Schaedlerella arabinosiphila]RRK34011.1 DUF5038 domain-containing protein [Schaedlerella arabinosiphila]
MSRKKFILSIFLMAALVSVGIILPAMHRNQTEGQPARKKSLPAAGKTTKPAPIKEESSLSGLQYLGFENLETFLPLIQIEDLKTQLASYLQETGYINIASVTFLADETTYPSNGETLFQFSLSDGSKLPVTCLTADGTFTFGEENQQTSTSDTAYTRIYTRQTDDTLPAVTTEEIEAMQEGGYADTENMDSNTASDSTVSGNQNDGTINHSGNNTEGVTP